MNESVEIRQPSRGKNTHEIRTKQTKWLKRLVRSYCSPSMIYYWHHTVVLSVCPSVRLFYHVYHLIKTTDVTKCIVPSRTGVGGWKTPS